MLSYLAWDSFCLNNYNNTEWHDDDEAVKQLKSLESPEIWRNSLQLVLNLHKITTS